MTINLALIDDHQLVLHGLEEKLQSVDQFTVVASYDNVEGFIMCLKNKQVDVIIMDLMLKEIHGFELIKQIRELGYVDLKIILISGFYEELLHKRALELGVKAFLRKEVSYDELISCIINVAAGNHILPEFLVVHTEHVLLSDVEREVLSLLIAEFTNEKIAQALFISRRTVETHVSTICRKLGVNSRIGAVREGLKLKLI
ncbi:MULTISPECIES: response regulator transcription factor [Pseudolactococcus]|uniref:Two-component response regulator n=2 Tax=Pseudolactococcus TaxID=3436058 RepID=A0A0D6DXF7_9LACT|nr:MULTISPECIES: response regulator transcription factor [Lactococcus]SCA92055.1 putative two-component system response regulator containing LuxR, C-terminal domain (vraR, luxR) [Lactococcus piscium]MCJ1968300.1 response regulator transcription factor [Lactococcus carnosus]MCJ1972504.1 response regulator transcription factor [Lactococcus carnosus]MCJ1981436.1 response regulator transcription factor [Lactococcus carnosus]MCJ1988942.1 response regulator transcription factor [Lactococcus carnosus